MPKSLISFIIPQLRKQKPILSKRLELVFWLLWGGLLGLSAPGGNLWGLIWIGFIPIYLFITIEPYKLSFTFLGTFCLGLGFYGVYHCWILGLHPLTWVGFSPIQSYSIALLAWLILTVYWSVFMGCFWTLSSWLNQKHEVFSLLTPLLWVGLTWVFQQSDFGVPWAMLEYTQSHSALLRSWVSFTGSSNIIVLLILYHNLIFSLWLKKAPKRWLIFFISLILPCILYLQPKIPQDFKESVLVIQGNIPIDTIRSSNKKSEAANQKYLSTLLEKKLPANTLIILPEEGPIPHWVSLKKPHQNLVFKQLSEWADSQQTYILSGMLTYNPVNGNQYNSLGWVSSKSTEQGFYHKQVLVPFGEKVPSVFGIHSTELFQDLLKVLKIDYAFGFKPGVKQKALHIEDRKIGGLICFELLYPQVAKSYKVENIDLLVNVSNLGWFHGHPWLAQQFLAIGQLRASETQVPLVIAANTGISAFINSSGSIIQQAPLEKPALLHNKHL